LSLFNDWVFFNSDIFEPLFEVTADPSSHPNLHIFLQRVIGFDSVDDESKAERRIYKKYPLPRDWDIALNPPYSYYLFYMFSNVCALNFWRRERKLSTLDVCSFSHVFLLFKLRPVLYLSFPICSLF